LINEYIYHKFGGSKAYIDKILKRYGMKKYKPGNTPVAKEDKFSLAQCQKIKLEKIEIH
jgi:hypothetical protein